MSDWEEDNTISLDDLESLENSQEYPDDIQVDEDDWGDSYDDLDSESWEKQFGLDDVEEEIERDPWELG